VSVLENAIVRRAITGKDPEPLGTRHPSATPFQAFPTADGYIVVALAFGGENQWQLLCGLLGKSELLDDERFNTGPRRTANHAALEPMLNDGFSKRTTAAWMDELMAVGIPCGPLNTVGEVMADPQVAHRKMIVEVEHSEAGRLPIANTPVRMSRSETGISGPPPDFGVDGPDVLRELLGLDDEAIDGLRERGVLVTEGGPDIASLL
ncbi:MAG: CoA transferase, partial [Dehalococcoidia bacterium]|nr:CoA transferase [Dehalococcoidia bacterium]